MTLNGNLPKINKLKFREKKLVVATHNNGKLNEIKELLKNINCKVYSSIELNLPVPKENGSTFEENALIKSSQTTELSGYASLSDDSGLMIDALDGAPGIYSADWAGHSRDFNKAIEKIDYLMRYKKDFSAKMVCVLCLTWSDKRFKLFKGEIKGKIHLPPRGTIGFGYDPIFIPSIQPFSNKLLTYGEIGPEFKNSNSHRNFAFNKLLDFITNDK